MDNVIIRRYEILNNDDFNHPFIKTCNNSIKTHVELTTDVHITTPLNYDVYRAGDTIYINGTIQEKRLKKYTIEYGKGIEPTEWKSTGINLANNGKRTVANDTIATWDTTHITEPDFYSLRITVTLRKTKTLDLLTRLTSLFNILRNYEIFNLALNTEETYFIKNIYLDPTLKKGWPVRIQWDINELSGRNVWSGKMEPVVRDVDNDGMMEIFVIVQAKPYSIIYGYEADGSFVNGWPKEILEEYNIYDPLPTGITPTIMDLDGDRYYEIIISTYSGLKIYSYNGLLKQEIPLILSSQPTVETVVFDLDNDGDFEFIKLYDPNEVPVESVAVLDHTGTMLDNWPQEYYNFSSPGGIFIANALYEAAPAIGNFDDDPEMEIVVVSGRNVFADPDNAYDTWHVEGRIHVFNIDGSSLEGFPLDVDGWMQMSPAVGDINKDGYDEIIVGSKYYGTEYGGVNFGLFAFDRFGHVCERWPQLSRESCGIIHHPALADFNGDGFLEIVAGTIDDYESVGNHVYVFDYKGNILPGWPQQTVWCSPVSPLIADITNDGIPGILVVAGSGTNPDFPGEGGIYAWNVDGTLIDGFPKIMEFGSASPATGDLDGDGLMELIGASSWDTDYESGENKDRSSLYVWELDCPYNESTFQWPMYHHDDQYSGWYHFK